MVNLACSRVLVTGGGGFLGRFVCEALRRRGVSAQRLCVPRRAAHDLTDGLAVEQLFTDFAPEVVLHLAAEVGGIGANQANPGRFFYANMAMGLHLVEAARRHGVRKFVQVGTVCAYPKHAAVPFREADLWNGFPEETNAPYGVAKKALLTMCQAYREQYGLPAIYLIPTNLYGPCDNFDPGSSHVIPAMIRRFCAAAESGDRKVVCWGDGTASRDFLYVEDAAQAIVRASETYAGSEPINLGSGVEITMRDLAHLIARLCDYRGEIAWDRSRPNGQPRRCLDISRARDRLGFRPTLGLKEGLRRTVAWYRDWQRGVAPTQPTHSVPDGGRALAGASPGRTKATTPANEAPLAEPASATGSTADAQFAGNVDPVLMFTSTRRR